MGFNLWRRVLPADSLRREISPVRVQEEGHLPPRNRAGIPVTSPPPRPPEERVPIRRAVLWSIVAFVLAAGVVLYFLFGQSIDPLINPGS